MPSKKTDPMIGMSPNTGILTTCRYWFGVLKRSELAETTSVNKKLVTPRTSRLSTTPTITWSTR